MSEIPSEIQCHFDADQVCPLKNAWQQLEELYAEPVEERGTLEEYYGRIKEIAGELSWLDRPRFYQMQGTSTQVGELSEHCDMGPHRSFLVFGKMVCNAAITVRSYGTPVETPSEAA